MYLGHVNIVARGASAAVSARLSLDGDGLSRANGLTELAGDAALLTRGIATKGVLATEARAERSLLKRIVDGVLWLEDLLGIDPEGAANLRQEHARGARHCAVDNVVPGQVVVAGAS